MFTKTEISVKKIMAATLAFCLMAVWVLQPASAASSGATLENKAARIIKQQVGTNDSARKKLKKLFTYLQKYDYARKTGF